MSRRLACFGLLLILVLGLGCDCIDRRFVFESDPPGSIVYVNGNLIGPSPGDMPFTYYGTYRFVYQRDGYETLTVDEKINPPWYEFFPLEFITENLLPFTVRDIRYIQHPLGPIVIVPPEEILRRADEMRAKGQSIGTAPVTVPLNPPGVTPVPPGALPPARAATSVPPGALPPAPGTTPVPPIVVAPAPTTGPVSPSGPLPPGPTTGPAPMGTLPPVPITGPPKQ